MSVHDKRQLRLFTTAKVRRPLVEALASVRALKEELYRADRQVEELEATPPCMWTPEDLNTYQTATRESAELSACVHAAQERVRHAAACLSVLAEG